ncbi:hypothetical protein L917_17806 [Phytophthora nicotianae]|uniref:Uncharacterized protein n=1 Tax=Phytophthora nicotianae TaxID=4792 RepID=W2KA16_PHYNI|nr:hypothetical protein L917_17806 [Phytophthora nicotianae]
MLVMNRATIEQYHTTHIKDALTANIPPLARLRKTMTDSFLLSKQFMANLDKGNKHWGYNMKNDK